MKGEELNALVEAFLAAWTSQDVERVLACYTEDLVYRDPNTRGEVRGRDAMRRYLTKLFASWTMTWHLREAFAHADGATYSLLWHATLRRASGGPTVAVGGMDLVALEGDRVRRNEVYFDRSVLTGVAGLEASR